MRERLSAAAIAATAVWIGASGRSGSCSQWLRIAGCEQNVVEDRGGAGWDPGGVSGGCRSRGSWWGGRREGAVRGEGGGAVDPWEKSEGRERWAAAHEIEGKR